MLLETLDIKKNDVLIYSENNFDFSSNFKIIFKHGASRNPIPINFLEIERYIYSALPKNLILYRMLTNYPAFNPADIKYGIRILINELPELVFYDPIFIIKDLERLREIIDFETFRFKIQQVGLSFNGTKANPINYAEVYAFDLNADEAQNQNDKVYAEAIFALDDKVFEDKNIENKKDGNQQKKEQDITKVKKNKYEILNRIDDSTEGKDNKHPNNNDHVNKKEYSSRDEDNSEWVLPIEATKVDDTFPESEEINIKRITDAPNLINKELDFLDKNEHEKNVQYEDLYDWGDLPTPKMYKDEEFKNALNAEITLQLSEDKDIETSEMRKVLLEVLDAIPQKQFLDKLVNMPGSNNLLKKTMERLKYQNDLNEKQNIKLNQELHQTKTDSKSISEPKEIKEKEPKPKSINEFLKKQKETSSSDEKQSDVQKVKKSEVLNLFKSTRGSDFLDNRMSESYTFKANQK